MEDEHLQVIQRKECNGKKENQTWKPGPWFTCFIYDLIQGST